jgi:hypothetical protein
VENCALATLAWSTAGIMPAAPPSNRAAFALASGLDIRERYRVQDYFLFDTYRNIQCGDI